MPSGYRWVVLAVCVFCFGQVHLHRLGFAPLIPTFVADLGVTYAAAGVIQTAYFWTYTAMQVPIGLLADRWGAVRVMLLFLTVLLAGALLFAGSQSFAQSLSARALIGLGAAAVWVPGMRLITEWFPARERGRVTGLFSAGGGIGATLALILIPRLAGDWGWRPTYAATAVPLVVAIGLILVVVRDPEGRAPATAAPRGALARVLATPAIWRYNATVLCSYGGYFSMLTFLPAFFAQGLGFSRPQAGVLTSLITAGTTLSWPVAGLISDRLGRRKVVYLVSQAAAAIACVLFALLAPGMSLAEVAAVAILTGIAAGGMITPYVMVIELFPRALAGTALGVTNTACFAGGMVLPIILGRIVDLTGSFAPALLVAAAVQALALAIGAVVEERPPTPDVGSSG
jgi:MFS family permease